jgi:hypothetical protein
MKRAELTTGKNKNIKNFKPVIPGCKILSEQEMSCVRGGDGDPVILPPPKNV